MNDNPYLDEAVADAENNGVPPTLFTNLIGSESGWNPDAVSPTGAVGLGQFLPSTAADPGYGVAPFDPNDPSQNLEGAAEYFSALRKATGSWEGALNAYNNGGADIPNNYNAATNDAALTADNGTSPAANSGGFWEGAAHIFNDIFGNPGDGSQIPTLTAHGNDLATRAPKIVAAAENWIEGGLLRIFVALFVLAIIIVSILALIKQKSPVQIIKEGAQAVKQ